MDWLAIHLEYEDSTPRLEDLDIRAGGAMRVLKKHAQHIRMRYVEKLEKAEKEKSVKTRKTKKADLPPYETANGYLKRAVYAFTQYLIKSKRIRIIERAIDQAAYFGKNPRSPDIRVNPFYWVLVLMFPNDELKLVAGDDGPMFQQDRNRLGLQLLYAHIHNVPPEYLVGFLNQSGGPKRILARLKACQPEPWFKGSWPELKKSD